MATEIYRAQVTVDMQGQMASIVMHFRTINPTSSDDFKMAGELVLALASGVAPVGFINRLVLLMSEDVFVSSIVCQKIFPTGGNSAHKFYQRDTEPGGVASPWHTGQLAGTAIWITSARPDVTGRNFIPGVPESMINGGRFETAYQTAFNNFITTCLAGFTSAHGAWELVVWDREDETPYLVDDGYLSSKPGTQRRRERPL
jgi:hypothetical protein